MMPSIICGLSLHSLPPDGSGGGGPAGGGGDASLGGQDIPERQFPVKLTKQFERKTEPSRLYSNIKMVSR